MSASVFISYARDDSEFAQRLYSDLRKSGITPWLDSYDLLPGQLWEKAIREAISRCSYFLVVLSSRSVTKRGYVQKEIRHALEVAEQYPEGRIFIIPVRIDDCEPSFDGLRRLHRADLFPNYESGLAELLRVFKYQSEEKPLLIPAAILPAALPRAHLPMRQRGVIARLTDRGFGFITPQTSDREVFFHHSELAEGLIADSLREGDLVEFILADGPKGKVARAINVTLA